MQTLQTFTLRELAYIEKEQYQNVLNANKRGEYVAIAVRQGVGKNTRVSYRYLSRRMSKILLALMTERVLDGAILQDDKAAEIATERKKTQKLSSHSSQYGKQ